MHRTATEDLLWFCRMWFLNHPAAVNDGNASALTASKPLAKRRLGIPSEKSAHQIGSWNPKDRGENKKIVETTN